MTQRFYLHNATTSVTGTLPGSTTVTSVTPVATVANASTNRSMDGTIGAGQVSVAQTTLNNQNAQQTWFRRWVSDPIAAQTVGDIATINTQWGAVQSNTNSNFRGCWFLGVWRPSSGSLVGMVTEDTVATTFEDAGFPGTSQGFRAATSPVSTQVPVTAQDGDILVLEFWRDDTSQSMNTAYTNTLFYDGTTESSATNEASYIDMGSDIAMFAAAASVPYSSPYPQLLAQ